MYVFFNTLSCDSVKQKYSSKNSLSSSSQACRSAFYRNIWILNIFLTAINERMWLNNTYIGSTCGVPSKINAWFCHLSLSMYYVKLYVNLCPLGGSWSQIFRVILAQITIGAVSDCQTDPNSNAINDYSWWKYLTWISIQVIVRPTIQYTLIQI